MKILVIGSGGREHALAWRIKQSPLATQVFCAPGNAGTSEDVVNIALAGHGDIIDFCKKEAIELVVVGARNAVGGRIGRYVGFGRYRCFRPFR